MTLSNFMSRKELIGFAILAVVIFLVFPAVLDSFRLNLFGKYLTYAFVAVGLALCWGAGGILSLGQGVFFGLGGYCMAMFLKLEASTPENTSIQSTPGIPDFMDWNQLTELPIWWQPFYSLTFALVAVVIVPVIFAFIIGFAMFTRRVGGVYFAIITQAFAAILTILIIGQQGYTGGVNGITDLRTLLGWDIRTDEAKTTLYFVNGVLLFAVLFVAQYVRKSKLGRLLIAMRDQEDRVRFLGLQRREFQDLRVLPRGRVCRHWWCHVHPAGWLHVAHSGRNRTVDRDGDLLCGRRAPVDPRRGLWRAAGELGQNHLFRSVPGTVVAGSWRVVHRGCDVLPQWAGRRLVGEDRAQATRPYWKTQGTRGGYPRWRPGRIKEAINVTSDIRQIHPECRGSHRVL